MNSFLAIDKLTKALAGILAMLATVAVLGAPLALAEYYGQAGAADSQAAGSLACRPVPAIPRHT